MATVTQQLATIRKQRQLDDKIVELFNQYVFARIAICDRHFIYPNDRETLDSFFYDYSEAEMKQVNATGWKADDAWVRFDEEARKLESSSDPWRFIPFEDFAHWCALQRLQDESLGLAVSQDENKVARDAEIHSWYSKQSNQK